MIYAGPSSQFPIYDGETVRVDIVEDQLVDPDRAAAVRDPLDELRRVGAPATDDRDLHSILTSRPVSAER